jgi:selenocysteine lyase/cysteine desulfurase
MPCTRREFLGTVSAATAISATSCVPAEELGDDPLGVRRDFPVIGESIYLDSPYITPSPRQAVDAAKAFTEAKGRDPVSLGAMLEESSLVRRRYAQLVNASEAEVGLLFATSEGENIVARALEFDAGDNVVIDDLHYDTTYVLYRHLAETRGVDLRVVASRDGVASTEAFAEYVDDRTRLVSVSWVSHQNGFQHDLKGLAELAHGHGAYLYADAIQGVGMLSLDVKDVGIDFFTAGTYKWLLGGFGVAPFYVREGLLDTIAVDRLGALHVAESLGDYQYRLYDDARKFGYATLAFGAVYQLGAGLDYLLQVGVENIERHTVPLAHRLRDGWLEQGYSVLTPANNRSAIVTIEHGQNVEAVSAALQSANLKVSLKENGTQIRAGAALFNNVDDVERLLEVTGELV